MVEKDCKGDLDMDLTKILLLTAVTVVTEILKEGND